MVSAWRPDSAVMNILPILLLYPAAAEFSSDEICDLPQKLGRIGKRTFLEECPRQQLGKYIGSLQR